MEGRELGSPITIGSRDGATGSTKVTLGSTGS